MPYGAPPPPPLPSFCSVGLVHNRHRSPLCSTCTFLVLLQTIPYQTQTPPPFCNALDKTCAQPPFGQHARSWSCARQPLLKPITPLPPPPLTLSIAAGPLTAGGVRLTWPDQCSSLTVPTPLPPTPLPPSATSSKRPCTKLTEYQHAHSWSCCRPLLLLKPIAHSTALSPCSAMPPVR